MSFDFTNCRKVVAVKGIDGGVKYEVHVRSPDRRASAGYTPWFKFSKLHDTEAEAVAYHNNCLGVLK